MEDLKFGIVQDYCDGGPGALMAPMDGGSIGIDAGLSKEACSVLTGPDWEYVEEGLYAFYDGSPEELREELEALGFTYDKDLTQEAEESFGDM